ncbi:hypothetical protein SMA5143A_4179 [Streptomyces sp. MA5143a]|nr:hypothetical protein SMA5143A_4179 [Streptomyces sp. MA5143a]
MWVVVRSAAVASGLWLSTQCRMITRNPRRTDKAITARTLVGKVCSGLFDVRRCLDRRSQSGSCLSGPFGHRRQLREERGTPAGARLGFLERFRALQYVAHSDLPGVARKQVGWPSGRIL